MLISELIEKLTELKAGVGDVKVLIEVGYFGGDYGGHNVYSKCDIEYTSLYANEAVLCGWLG